MMITDEEFESEQIELSLLETLDQLGLRFGILLGEAQANSCDPIVGNLVRHERNPAKGKCVALFGLLAVGFFALPSVQAQDT